MRLIGTPQGTKRVTEDTAVILDVLHEARMRHGFDPVAACAAMLEESRSALRTWRRMQRRSRTPRVAEYLERRCRGLLNRNRRLRRLARQYGWTFPGERR